MKQKEVRVRCAWRVDCGTAGWETTLAVSEAQAVSQVRWRLRNRGLFGLEKFVYRAERIVK